LRNNAFSPHSRNQDERSIVRFQNDFSAGVFAETPKISIPNNGLAYLKNAKNYGNRIEGRRGSRLWYGYDDFSLEWVSSAFPFNGTLYASYYHKNLNQVFLLVDNDVWVSYDETLIHWYKAVCDSFQKPHNSPSVFSELNNDVILFNINGIYKFSFFLPFHVYEGGNLWHYQLTRYFKINSDIPSISISTNETEEDYKYRYIYSMSKISGGLYGLNNQKRDYDFETDTFVYDNMEQIFQANRSNHVLINESGTNKYDLLIPDYSLQNISGLIDIDSPSIISGLTVPTISGSLNHESHWDCFSIWRTKDIGINGYDITSGISNDPELFVWVDDIPICQAIEVTCTDSTHFECQNWALNWSGLEEKTIGYLNKYDVGSLFYVVSGSDYICQEILDVNDEIITVSGTIFPSGSTKYAAFIGTNYGGYLDIISESDIYTMTVTSDNYNFNNNDIGKCIHTIEGNVFRINDISGNLALISGYYPFANTNIPCCWDLNSRNYCDTNSDQILDSRISSFPCYQRLYDALPTCNIGTVTPGMLFSAMKDSNFLYYSQVPNGFEYLTGYYHPLYQNIYIKNGIKSLKKMPDKVVVYSQKSTSIIPVNVTNSISIENLGVDVTVLAGQTEIDNNIGVIAEQSICSLENGNHILITNEPAIRIFNGEQYGPNLAYPYFQKILSNLGPNIMSSYNSLDGYTFWVSGNNYSDDSRCFNLGLSTNEIPTSQGIGFSENTGSFPFPYNNGIIEIIDRLNYNRTIILDQTDTKFYDITTKDFYQNTNFSISDLTPAYTDKTNFDTPYAGVVNDRDGIAIEPEIIFKSDTGELKNYIIESDFHNFDIDRIYGTDELNLSFLISLDSKTQYTTNTCSNLVYTTSVNKLPTIVFDKKIEGNEIYTTISANGSNFSLNYREQHYIVKDIKYNYENDVTGNFSEQEELGQNLLLWWTIKDSNPLLDRISGLTLSGYCTDDGNKWTQSDYSSNMILNYDTSFKALSGNISLPQISYTGDKSLLLFCQYSGAEINLNGESTLLMSSVSVNDDWGVGSYWIHLISGISGSGTINIILNTGTYQAPYRPRILHLDEFLDLRLFQGNITSGSTQYMIDDMFKNYGDNVLPL
jgi:hypothetical protein